MIFGHWCLDINLLKASKNVFEPMSVVSSKQIPLLKQHVINK